MKISGIENLTKTHNYIIASKHQSAWETVFYYKLLAKSCFIYKRSLGFIPIFGWYLKLAGNISINRSKGASEIKQLGTKVQKKLDEDRAVIIFPEGTRTDYGVQPELKSGIFKIYDELQISVIPFSHNAGKFWGKNAFVKTPGIINLQIHEPIKPGLSRAEFLKTLHEKINSEK